MRIQLWATVLAVTAAATPADAKHLRSSVDPDVTSVVFDKGTRTRAVAGDRDGAFLVIERMRGERVTDMTPIVDLPIGRSMVPMTEFKDIVLTSLRGTSLEFQVEPRMRGARDKILCSATLEFDRGRAYVRSTSCTQNQQPYYGQTEPPAPPPPPYQQPPYVPPRPPHNHPQTQISTETLRAATDACEEAFSFPSDRKKCLDQTIETLRRSSFRSSAIPAIEACEDAFSFPSDRHWCISAASSSQREPVDLIRYCADKQSFPSDRKTCITQFAATP